MSRITPPDADPADEKLQKVLARAGIGSRRDMEKLIADGRVTVNEHVAQLGDRVGERDRIAVDGRPLLLKPVQERSPRVLIYNKPEGEICSARDPEGRPTVFDRLPKVKGERWISIGRLDFNTSGLLLFSNDGELANALMHPSSGIDREYLCRVLGEVDDDMLARLRAGVQLEDGPARFTDITTGGGSGANRWFYVCLMEGRNREVRRLWESQEIKVSRLKRVRFGPVFLPARLKQGYWEDLAPDDVKALYRVAGLRVPTIAPLKPQERHQREREQGKKPQPRTPRERSARPVPEFATKPAQKGRRNQDSRASAVGAPDARTSGHRAQVRGASSPVASAPGASAPGRSAPRAARGRPQPVKPRQR